MRYSARFYEDDGGWIVEIQDIGGRGIFTQGDTLDECRHMAQDAVTSVLVAEADHGETSAASSPRLPEGPGWEWVYPFPSAMVALQIRQIRQQSNKSMADVASSMGVGPSTYQRWENPRTSNATVKTLEKVATALGRRLNVELIER